MAYRHTTNHIRVLDGALGKVVFTESCIWYETTHTITWRIFASLCVKMVK